MSVLLIGLAIFFAVHLIPVLGGLRGQLIQALGEGGYKGLFSIGAFVGLVLIIWGFGSRDFVPLYDPPLWTRHLVFLLMLPSLVLLAAAYIPSRIRTVVQHPMLASVKIWAFGHLLANGDLGSVLLFGSFLAYAVIDRISVKRRGAMGPLGTKAGGLKGDIAAIVAGLVAYAIFLLWGHEYLIGVPLFDGVMIPS